MIDTAGVSLFLLQLSFAGNPAFYFNIGKNLLLDSKRVLMTDLGTIQNWPNLSKHQYYLTSTKFLIWKIDKNVSSFQSLNMLSFHIRLLHLKLICYDLISIFVTFGTMYILFLSSHVFISLKFNSIHISVLFWNIVKPQWN